MSFVSIDADRRAFLAQLQTDIVAMRDACDAKDPVNVLRAELKAKGLL